MAQARTSAKSRQTKSNATREADAGGEPMFVTRALRSLNLPQRLKRDLLAALALLGAVVLSLGFTGLAAGTPLAWFTDGLRYLLGYGAIAAPLGLAVVAVEIWSDDDDDSRWRRVVGAAMSGISILGLLGFAFAQNSYQSSGGLFGDVLSDLLAVTIGEPAGALSLFVIGVAGVLLATDTDSDTIRWAWWRLRAGRERDAFDDEEFEDIDSSSDQENHWSTEFMAAPEATSTHIQEEIKPEKRAAPRKPVINLPKRSRKPKSGSDEVKEAVALSATFDLVGETQAASWKLPPLELLNSYGEADPDQGALESKAKLIEETLKSFKVEATVREIFPGPSVTLFALEPGPGVKVSKITSLHSDLALALAAPTIRIEAPVPGMARVGIEVPNADIATVGVRDVLESTTKQVAKAKLPLPLGRDVNGRAIIADLARMPHLLIAGATGSGKSVAINSIIATFLLTRTPDEVQMLLIDPKMVELVGFKSVPHLKGPIVTEMNKVTSALRMVLQEMERRYQLFADLGVRNIDGYNLRREDDPDMEHLSYLVVIIDELADLMMTAPEEVETLLARLCQMARATGIHMLISTQRPSVDVLTGLIKANVPSRIAFAVASQTDSRVILDMPGAERLIGGGDMLFLPGDAAKPKRIQGSYISDLDLQTIVTFWRKQQPRPQFDDDWAEFPSAETRSDSDEDPLMEQALEIVRQHGSASASMLQRRLRIGYNRAARMIESMEDEGVVGPSDGPRGRAVFLDEG